MSTPSSSAPVAAGPARSRQRVGAMLAAALLLTPLCVSAQDDAPAADAGDAGWLAVPENPEAPYGGESVGAPEVTIIETDREVITEYRVRGRLYLVRIEPVAGPPYYLLDVNGDGVLDVQQGNMPDLALPQWQLFSW